MPCDTIPLGGGGVVIVCTRGPRRRTCSVAGCGAPAPFLCDGPGEGRPTCDAPICGRHALHVGRDRDLCPSCAAKRRPEPRRDHAKRLRRPEGEP